MIPDEHYVPVLLAALGKENETDCYGGLTSVDWYRAEAGGHPYTYRAYDVHPALYAHLSSVWSWDMQYAAEILSRSLRVAKSICTGWLIQSTGLYKPSGLPERCCIKLAADF